MVEIFGHYPIGFASVVTHEIHVTRKSFNSVYQNCRLGLRVIIEKRVRKDFFAEGNLKIAERH